jgi:hypothetical protein
MSLKKILTIASFLLVAYCFSQSVNDYKAVIIPLKYDFQKEENQYRIQTFLKMNLISAGFTAFYSNEVIPPELDDRCKLLTVDVIKESSFLVTKLDVVLKDCYGLAIFKSEQGKSREKNFEDAYFEALKNAFKSIYALEYKYNNSFNSDVKPTVISSISTGEKSAYSVNIDKKEVNPQGLNNDTSLLYAQLTAYGYQLIDSEPKVVMKVFKTSNPASYMATKGTIQGVLVSKDNQWFFEYYQNDQLISESINVKF